MAGDLILVIDDSPTILKVVERVLTKSGFEVALAGDGEEGLAAARQTPPDLILLDFVMPKMNGYQLCRELAADPVLKEIPVVLMSAKGDQIGERFVQVMGIVDYVTKPFSPEAITAVVEHAVAKFGRRHHDTANGATAPIGQAKPTVEPTPERIRALDKVRDTVSQLAAPRVAALLAGGDGRPDVHAIAEAIRCAFDDKALGAILAASDGAIIADAAPGLRGDLQVVPLAEVLQLLDVQEQSGILTVERGGASAFLDENLEVPNLARVDVFFRRGRVELAVASGLPEEFLLGRFILELELMSQGDFDAFLNAREGTGQLLGADLVKASKLSAHDLTTCLARQTSDLVYEVLRWRSGRFRFVADGELSAAAAEAALELDVQAILMEGFRRVDEWHLIERAIDDFDLIFLRNEDAVSQMGRGRLTREELTILELVNGKNTVKELIRKSRMGSFEVSKMLYRLLSIKLIRRRVLPVAV